MTRLAGAKGRLKTVMMKIPVHRFGYAVKT